MWDPGSVNLISIGTAVPPNVIDQQDVSVAARQAFATRYSEFGRLAGVFESSGVRQRYAVRPLEWYLQPLGWPERSEAYLGGAC